MEKKHHFAPPSFLPRYALCASMFITSAAALIGCIQEQQRKKVTDVVQDHQPLEGIFVLFSEKELHKSDEIWLVKEELRREEFAYRISRHIYEKFFEIDKSLKHHPHLKAFIDQNRAQETIGDTIDFYTIMTKHEIPCFLLLHELEGKSTLETLYNEFLQLRETASVPPDFAKETYLYLTLMKNVDKHWEIQCHEQFTQYMNSCLCQYQQGYNPLDDKVPQQWLKGVMPSNAELQKWCYDEEL